MCGVVGRGLDSGRADRGADGLGYVCSVAEYGDLELLDVTIEAGVARVVIDHPPMNLLSMDLMRELNGLHRLVEADDAVRVVVFSSADPDFFIAHADGADILSLPEDLSPPLDEIVGFHRLDGTMADLFQADDRAAGGPHAWRWGRVRDVSRHAFRCDRQDGALPAGDGGRDHS